MLKRIGSLLVTVLSGALMIYSATRSFDFIALTLPPEKKILAYFALAALDGGVVAWSMAYLYGSRGGWQRAISIMMVVVDVLGAVALFTFDALYRAGERGLIAGLSPEAAQTAILALSGVIALNIIAGIGHLLTDPDKLKMQAEEEAYAHIEEAALEQIHRSAAKLASQLAPTIASKWAEETRAKYLSAARILGATPTLPAALPADQGARVTEMRLAQSRIAQPAPDGKKPDLGPDLGNEH